MRILHVTYIFPPKAIVADGITRVVYNQTKALAKMGHDVTVYTSNALDLHSKGRIKINKFPDNIEGVKVRYFPYLLRYGTIFFTPSMFHSIRDDIKRFDVIHIHDARSIQCAIATYYAGLFNIPIVFQPHGSFISPLPSGRLRRLLRLFADKLYAEKVIEKISKIVTLSRMEADQYRRMGVPEEKIAIIPNGIDLSEYAKLPPKGCFKKKFGIPEDRKIILYLGRIHRTKGIDFLVRAYAHLINEMNYRDTVLVIAGPDDGYLKEVQELTNSLGVSKHVLFTGPLYGWNKLEAYIDSEFYVLPSRYETFPMTVLEAYACIKPVIASEVGGLKDLVMNGETGLLFELGNVKQLARSIFNLANDNGLAKRMGLKGRKFVEGNFTIEKVVERLEKVYEEVVEG